MYKTLVKSDGVLVLSVLVWNGRGRISSARAVRSSSEWSIGGAIVVNAPEIVSVGQGGIEDQSRQER